MPCTGWKIPGQAVQPQGQAAREHGWQAFRPRSEAASTATPRCTEPLSGGSPGGAMGVLGLALGLGHGPGTNSPLPAKGACAAPQSWPQGCWVLELGHTSVHCAEGQTARIHGR